MNHVDPTPRPSPVEIVEAAFRAIKTAAERIDMRRHRGEHARLGRLGGHHEFAARIDGRPTTRDEHVGGRRSP